MDIGNIFGFGAFLMVIALIGLFVFGMFARQGRVGEK
jgi:hypothetical protein